MSVRNTTGEILYVNADWSKIVPENSREAAFVLVGVGGKIPTEHIGLYLTHVGGDAEEVPDEPTEKVIRFGGDKSPAAETPKPRKRAAKKKAAAKSDD